MWYCQIDISPVNYSDSEGLLVLMRALTMESFTLTLYYGTPFLSLALKIKMTEIIDSLFCQMRTCSILTREKIFFRRTLLEKTQNLPLIEIKFARIYCCTTLLHQKIFCWANNTSIYHWHPV